MTAGPISSGPPARGRAATLREAVKIRAACSAQLAGHVKVCGQCRTDAQPVAIWCDEGWELAKAYAAARADVSWHQDRIDHEYPGLF